MPIVLAVWQSRGSGRRVESRILKLTSEEGVNELLRPGEVLGWQIRSGWLLTPVLHVGRLIQRVANLQRVLWELDGFRLVGELLGDDVLFLDEVTLVLDALIAVSVQFPLFARLLEEHVIIRLLGIFQLKLSLTLDRLNYEVWDLPLGSR